MCNALDFLLDLVYQIKDGSFHFRVASHVFKYGSKHFHLLLLFLYIVLGCYSDHPPSTLNTIAVGKAASMNQRSMMFCQISLVHAYI